ncbi:dihydrofolate reductase family protein [Dyadobacter sp. CY107]|uniref:dihydrofolate reductase family protein n=1 Tax=Dyadobacter fanqingshengii TaxID=2906443 RepID=UPI001F23AF93|nr:dihydrofolate reductase family protein [Dyadobacter fanqingshengii]MCF2502023.1 dihydrofolate reductase family protein [Dyadobacter fanqingshengii]
MRKLVYHVGATLDNFIAHEDGSAKGFIYEGDHVADYTETLLSYDTVLMGRKTYEFGYQYGLQPGQPAYPHMKHYIFSKSMHLDLSANEQVEIIDKNEVDFIQRLKAGDGPPLYLCGGSSFAGFLLEQELIDELKVKLYPVLFGKGIPLLETDKEVKLSLLDSKVYETGVLLISYQIHY